MDSLYSPLPPTQYCVLVCCNLCITPFHAPIQPCTCHSLLHTARHTTWLPLVPSSASSQAPHLPSDFNLLPNSVSAAESGDRGLLTPTLTAGRRGRLQAELCQKLITCGVQGAAGGTQRPGAHMHAAAQKGTSTTWCKRAETKSPVCWNQSGRPRSFMTFATHNRVATPGRAQSLMTATLWTRVWHTLELKRSEHGPWSMESIASRRSRQQGVTHQR